MTRSNAEWIARKLGQAPPPPPVQQQPPAYYPQYPQQQPVYPQYQQPQYHPQPQPQYYQQPQYQQPVVPLKPDGKLDVNAARLMYGKDYEGIVAQHWQGGEATRNENQPCPKCHEGVLFSMHNTEAVLNATTGQMVYTAPYCATCGYRPGRHMQGDMANWAVTA